MTIIDLVNYSHYEDSMFAILLLLSCLSYTAPEPEVLPSEELWASTVIQDQPDTPVVSISAERWSDARLALVAVSTRWQLIDKNENWIFSRLGFFETDLNFVRKRFQELKDSPLVEEADIRFPSRGIILSRINLNREYRVYLENRMIWEQDRADLLKVAIDETIRAGEIWQAMYDAKADYNWVSVRRLAISRFRHLVGKKLWESGIVPDYVPIWRFEQR